MTTKSERVKLTKSFIESLPLQPAIFRDSELIGFALRVQKTYKTYIVEKKVKGRAVRHTLGIVGQMTLAQARQKASETLALMGRGIDPNAQKRQEQKAYEQERELHRYHPTLSDAYTAFKAERSLKPNTLRDYDKVMGVYLATWQAYKLGDINRKMIQEKHKELTKISPAQANMVMRVFRAVYNFAVEHYLDDDENPILSSIAPTRTLTAKKSWNNIKRRKTYINEDKMPDWVRAVIEFDGRGQSRDTNKEFILTLILTGFRRAECESIAWSAVDLRYGFITSIDPKNGEVHSLPMGDVLWAIMKKRHRQRINDWVFESAKSKSGHIENISKVREKINAQCGIQFTFHDLRRTFGSIAENLDYGQYTIKRLLNHKSAGNSDVTAGYVQVSDKKLRQAMNDIEMTVLGEWRDILLQEYNKKAL